MNSAVCTLFEGDYHYGLGALVNSLYNHGFRGVVWAGYKGALPPWATGLTPGKGYDDFAVTADCHIHFVPISTASHFANYKPEFMLSLWEQHCSETEILFYFDPDIVLRCRWSFYEEWAVKGIALCQEIVNGYMSSDHPIRLEWKEFASQHGHTCCREIDRYYNSGFIGLTKEHKSFLCIWRDLIEDVRKQGVPVDNFVQGDRSQPFHIADQDTFNLAAMISSHPLSSIGPEGMGFEGGGFTMVHATGSPKPWCKHMVREALSGKAPTLADKMYWMFSNMPISLYNKNELLLKRMDLRCGSALGRFIRRS